MVLEKDVRNRTTRSFRFAVIRSSSALKLLEGTDAVLDLRCRRSRVIVKFGVKVLCRNRRCSGLGGGELVKLMEKLVKLRVRG